MLSAQLPAWVARLVTLGQQWLFVSLQLEVAGPHPFGGSKVMRGDGSSEKDRAYSGGNQGILNKNSRQQSVFSRETFRTSQSVVSVLSRTLLGLTDA